MPDVVHVHALFFVKRLLERQNHHHLVHIAADLLDAPFLPRPDLRGNVIDNLEVLLFREFGDAEVESGIVHQHEDIRLPREDIPLAYPDVPQHFAQMHKNLPKTHESHLLVVHKQLCSSLLH